MHQSRISHHFQIVTIFWFKHLFLKRSITFRWRCASRSDKTLTSLLVWMPFNIFVFISFSTLVFVKSLCTSVKSNSSGCRFFFSGFIGKTPFICVHPMALQNASKSLSSFGLFDSSLPYNGLLNSVGFFKILMISTDGGGSPVVGWKKRKPLKSSWCSKRVNATFFFRKCFSSNFDFIMFYKRYWKFFKKKKNSETMTFFEKCPKMKKRMKKRQLFILVQMILHSLAKTAISCMYYTFFQLHEFSTFWVCRIIKMNRKSFEIF